VSSILVIDEESVYRRGFRALIEARLGSRVIEASRFEGPADASFDLVLIDAGSLNTHARGVLAEMHRIRPTTRVAVLSTARSRTDVLNCLAEGFHGFVDKDQSDDGLLAAISDLLSGRIYVPPWVAAHHQPEVQHSINIGQEQLNLTRRQGEVLRLLALGMSNKAIARKLNIAEGTIKIHIAAILRALDARNRTEAALLAQKIIGSGQGAAGLFNDKRDVWVHPDEER
jgi:DNA-binding NarL/FixJ family response regulator